MLDVEGMAAKLEVCPQTIRRMVKRGDLKAFKVKGSKAFKFKPSEAQRAFEEIQAIKSARAQKGARAAKN